MYTSKSKPPAVATPADSDKVGYKKPPKGAQWKKGQSGNPKGRPKGSRSLTTILRDELDKPLQARVGGRIVTITRREALVQKQLELALKGDTRAFVTLLKLDPAALTPDDADDGAREAPLSKAEQEVFAALLTRSLTPEREDDQ